MKKKNFAIASLVMTALMIILGVLENHIFDRDVFSAVNPIFYIATLVCGYFVFKDTVAFKSKWTWAFIGIFFTYALNYVAGISYIFTGYYILDMLMRILCAAGAVCILISVLYKDLAKLMHIGFGLLALDAVLRIMSGMPIFEILCYAFFILMALNRFPAFNKYFRFGAILFALISINYLGIYLTVAYIILAFLLVPGVKKFVLTGAKVTAILCIITAIIASATLVDNSPIRDVEYASSRLASVKDELDACPTEEECEEKIVKCNEEIDSIEKDINKEDVKLIKAEDKLDDVCHRSYFSYFSCERDECYDLHSNVRKIENKISSLEDDIEEQKELIAEAEEAIERRKILEEEVSALRVEYFETAITALMLIMAFLLSLAGLICFAVCLFRGMYGIVALLSCAVIGVASFIYMIVGTRSFAFWSFDIFNYPIFRFVASPYFWSIVASSMLAVIFVNKEKRPVKFRVFTILAAVIMAILSAINPSSVALVFAVYAVTIISLSLVLVPLIFTEYNGIAKHIFFTIITLGIWRLIWIYNVTKNLNKVSSCKNRKPLAELLLCIFLPFYNIYWVVKTAETVEAYGEENGKKFNINILCLVFMFVCPIISTVIIQDKINAIVGNPN